MKFFSYDPDDGFELHATEDEAKARAQAAIDLYRDDAADGWPEEVDGVCWGALQQRAIEANKRPNTEHESASCDYQLADA